MVNICTTKFLKKRIPIISWLPLYSLKDLRGDFIAGITVALTVIPQGLALAQLALLPPQYGLYTAFMGCFVYTIFGSCKDLTIGPTAIISLMTAELVNLKGVNIIILLTFLAGTLQVLMGLLNLGILVSYISNPVINGFTSAAALTIASSQLAGIFGFKIKGHAFADTIYKFICEIKNIRLWDSILGVCCIFILLAINILKDKRLVFSGSAFKTKLSIVLNKSWQAVSLGKNALLVLVTASMVAILLMYKIDPFVQTQDVKPGLPPFKLPQFSYHYYDNSTNTTIVVDFIDTMKEISASVVLIAMICIIEAIAIAKAFTHNKKLDATQEMIALGLSNIIASFFSAFPATGSFSRTAINNVSGVRTPLGGVFTGGTVLLALWVMAPFFKYIPKASLCAMIFVAVLKMVHYKEPYLMWKTKKMDLFPWITTFILSLVLGLEYGFLAGILISLLLLIRENSNLKIAFQKKTLQNGVSYLYVMPDRNILYPTAETFFSDISKKIAADNNINFLLDESTTKVSLLVIDCHHLISFDFTMIMNLKNFSSALQKQKIKFICLNLKPSILLMLEKLGTLEIECYNSLQEVEATIQNSEQEETQKPLINSSHPSSSPS